MSSLNGGGHMKQMGKVLTYEEFIALGKANYTNGGDVVYECWERYEFEEYVKMFGAMTEEKAMSLFRLYKSQEDEAEEMSRW